MLRKKRNRKNSLSLKQFSVLIAFFFRFSGPINGDPSSRYLIASRLRAAYDELAEEFAFLDEVLNARTKTGLTQAEVAERMGTTQSAVARLESANAKHSPSLATLRRYALALGHRVEVRLVKA